MHRLALAAPGGRTMQVDLCGTCHLLWFDTREPPLPAPRGILALLRAMRTAHRAGTHHERLRDWPACPRCGQRLEWVRHASPQGGLARHACPHGHGVLHSFSSWLGWLGFARALQRPELRPATVQPAWQCLNCGTPGRCGEACSLCGAAPRVLDLRLLARALDHPSGRRWLRPSPRLRELPCTQCGAGIDPLRDRRCPECSAPSALTSLGEALAALEPLAAAAEGRASGAPALSSAPATLDRPPGGPARLAAGLWRVPAWWFMAAAAAMAVLGALLLWMHPRLLG